ncbi:MAG TPA: outer membrane beta-barrel protein [Cyclobacteriaceae bacterium]|nr:outer membrane beta-barrel protein [Cyclobacteriaceae bacterium]
MRRLLPLLALLILSSTLYAQSQRKPPAGFKKKVKQQQNSFLDKQWWIGLKIGPNLTKATPETRYSVLTPTNYALPITDKKYDGFKKLGSQATLEITFNYKGIGFSFQPTYRLSRFTYTNEFMWDNPENAAEMLELKYDHELRVDYADLPLIVKYDITGNTLRPYVQGGIFYSMLVNANKTVEISGTDFASGGTNALSSEPVIVGAKDLFHKSYWGLMAGAGLHYNLGNVRLVFDASYRIGMSNVTDTKNRFSNDRLSGIGDALDDMKTDNIVLSIGCLFPMRFLSTSFKSIDR